MRLHAYEDGRRWYGRALELGEGVLDDVARCRLMTAYAGAQCLSSDFNGALRPASTRSTWPCVSAVPSWRARLRWCPSRPSTRGSTA